MKAVDIFRSFALDMLRELSFSPRVLRYRHARCAVLAFSSFQIVKDLLVVRVYVSAFAPSVAPGKLSKCSPRNWLGQFTRSLLIHSILSRRTNPGSRLCLHAPLSHTVAWLVTFLLGTGLPLISIDDTTVKERRSSILPGK